MRSLFGIGTPRALQGGLDVLAILLSTLWSLIYEAIVIVWRRGAHSAPSTGSANASIAFV
jgi:hypothetical protein